MYRRSNPHSLACVPFARASAPAVVPVAEDPVAPVAPRPRPPDHDEERTHDEPLDIETPAGEPPVEATMDVDMLEVAAHVPRSPVDLGAKKPLTIASGAAC